MVKKRKLLRKILAGSKNVQFDEFASLLAAFGFELKRIKGSHHIFKHPASPDLLSVQPDSNNRAKPYQIKQFLRLIEEYNLTLDDGEEPGEGDEK